MAGGNLVRDVLAVLEVVVSFVKEGFESLTADSDKYQEFCDLNELECCVLLEEHFPCDESERLVMTCNLRDGGPSLKVKITTATTKNHHQCFLRA